MNASQEFCRLRKGMRDLDAANFERPAALATITRTSGSTFRHAGTSMLVKSDGMVVCALSGGCPQRDIVARASHVIAHDRPELARYNKDSSLDVLMEMGCGGEMDVLIEPLTRAQDIRFLDALEKSQTLRVAGFMATVFAREGIALSPRPQRLVWVGGTQWSNLDDTALTSPIMGIGLGLGAHSRVNVHRLDTAQGVVDVLFEALRPAHRLTLIGVNAVSLALAQLSVTLGWETLLVDHVDPASTPAGLPAGVGFLQAPAESLRRAVSFDRFSSVVVMTFNVERDISYLTVLADAPVVYLGAITSRERATRMRAVVDGTRLHAPAGLDLGSQTPEEIALAVSAEILAVVNARAGGCLDGSGDAIGK